MRYQAARLRPMNVRPIHRLVTELVAEAEDEPAVHPEALTEEVEA